MLNGRRRDQTIAWIARKVAAQGCSPFRDDRILGKELDSRDPQSVVEPFQHRQLDGDLAQVSQPSDLPAADRRYSDCLGAG
jgi:hypothetical protein